MDFDEAYRKTEGLFGDQPEKTLRDFASRLAPGTQVLDVGCGQGRNTLFLARRGATVDALDPSPEAVAQVQVQAREEGLSVNGLVGTLDSLADRREVYSGVLIYGLFPLLTPEQIHQAVGQSVELLSPGGVLFVTAFTTEDPGYGSWKQRSVRRQGHCFWLESGRLRTFLEPGELVGLYQARGLEALHQWEGLGPEHRHGDHPPERHGMAEAVLLKTRPGR